MYLGVSFYSNKKEFVSLLNAEKAVVVAGV